MRAVIVGAGGAIGSALVDALCQDARYHEVHACSRREVTNRAKLIQHTMDTDDESSVASVFKSISVSGALDLVIVATGILHNQSNLEPEKSLKMVDPDNLSKYYEVNCVGPATVAKYALPCLNKKSRSVFAAISARVGSVSDNRLGGWYGYRMSKAALNMFIKCAAIETRRSNAHAIVLALHPGTVDSPLSQPFQSRVDPDKLFSPERAATQLLAVMDQATAEQTGRILAWDGSEIQP